MPNAKVRHMLGKMGADPQFAHKLAQNKDPKGRKALLAESGIIAAADAPPTEAEIRKEIIELLSSTGTQTAQGERPVEWVAAIATAAALF